jgi:hypothetical protein
MADCAAGGPVDGLGHKHVVQFSGRNAASGQVGNRGV